MFIRIEFFFPPFLLLSFYRRPIEFGFSFLFFRFEHFTKTMMISKASILLLLVCLFFVASSFGDDDLDCTSELLPRSFNGPAFLGDDNHFHVAGRYRINMTANTQNISFALQDNSFVRFAVSQNPSPYLRLTLYSLGPEHAVSMNANYPESSIWGTLTPGNWRLSMTPTTVLPDCHIIFFEADITPLSEVLSRKADYSCPAGTDTDDNVPDAQQMFGAQNTRTDGSIYYSTLKTQTQNKDWFAARNPTTQEQQQTIRWIKGWNFTLPLLAGRSGLWSFKANIGYDFLTSGSLGLMISSSTIWNPTAKCDGCTFGLKEVQNHNVLHDLLAYGSYTLWMYERANQKNTTISDCSPYTLEIEITPIDEEENELSCTAPQIPPSLNDPGLIDESGVLDYLEYPFIDLSGGADKHHYVNFTLTKPSFFRVYILSSGADLDLDLLNSSKKLYSSYRTFGVPDVIVAQLLPGDYNIDISVFGSWPDSFCDTFMLQISIYPAVTFSDDYCTDPSNGGVLQVVFPLFFFLE